MIRWGVLVGLLAVATAAPLDVPEAAGSVSAGSYYLARGDPRLCPSPMCGGLFVHLVNRSSAVCGDGTTRQVCYVASADLSSLVSDEQERIWIAGLVSAGRAVVRGTIVPGRVPGFPQLDVLQVSQVWEASSSPRAPVGVFRRLQDNGTPCPLVYSPAMPCFDIRATRLNSSRYADVSRVDLTPSSAPRAERRRAFNQVATTGLVAAGHIVREWLGGSRARGRAFVASQFYVLADPSR